MPDAPASAASSPRTPLLGPAVSQERVPAPLPTRAVSALPPFTAPPGSERLLRDELPPAPAAPPAEAVPTAAPSRAETANSLNEVAERLERIAASLRARSAAGGVPEFEGVPPDPLEMLITGFVFGYLQGAGRAPLPPPP